LGSCGNFVAIVVNDRRTLFCLFAMLATMPANALPGQALACPAAKRPLRIANG
jgi:hypothetical protein